MTDATLRKICSKIYVKDFVQSRKSLNFVSFRLECLKVFDELHACSFFLWRDVSTREEVEKICKSASWPIYLSPKMESDLYFGHSFCKPHYGSSVAFLSILSITFLCLYALSLPSAHDRSIASTFNCAAAAAATYL